MEHSIRIVELIAAIAGLVAAVDALLRRWKENRKIAITELTVGILLVLSVVSAYVYSKFAERTTGSSSCLNRPCVAVEEIKLIHDPPRLAVTFRNSGGMPAFHVAIRVRPWADNDFDPNKAREDMLPAAHGEATLGHDQWGRLDPPLALKDEITLDRLEAVMAGRLRSGVFGELQYEDSFGNHYAPRFCVTWSAVAQDFVVCGKTAFIDGQKP
jgi:hypothetical protein